MPKKDTAATWKQKQDNKKAAEQEKANKNNDRNKTKTNINSTGTKNTGGGTTSNKTTGSTGNKTTGSTGNKTTGSTGNKTTGSTGNKTTGSTGGTSLPSLSKDVLAAWEDAAKNGETPAAPGLPSLGTKVDTPNASGTGNKTSSTGSAPSQTTPRQTSSGTASSGYDNDGLTAEQIKAMQRFYGTDADGLWGAKSTTAAGGKTAAEAWNAYQTALREQQQQQEERPNSGTPNGGTTPPSIPTGDTGKLTADVSGMRDLLDQWLSAAKQQQEAAINYGVEQGANELRRAEEDAQQQFQEQQNQIDLDEARAKDNQALYAEARGDRGGIGAAQYDSIMNAAAQNRLTVSQQQTKLSTDTARQIADLRAQGEYKKADAVLELTQKYLTQLMSLEQWALDYQMDVEQFNLQLEKWQAEYALSLAKLNGTGSGRSSSTSSDSSSSTSSGGTVSGSSGLNPSSMTAAEIKEWQRRLGVTADGIWGPNTQAAYDAIYGRGGSSTQFTGTKPNTGRTSLDYSPDEGIFTYAGKTYSTIAGVVNAINNANLSDAEFAQVKAKLEALTGVKWQ